MVVESTLQGTSIVSGSNGSVDIVALRVPDRALLILTEVIMV